MSYAWKLHCSRIRKLIYTGSIYLSTDSCGIRVVLQCLKILETLKIPHFSCSIPQQLHNVLSRQPRLGFAQKSERFGPFFTSIVST